MTDLRALGADVEWPDHEAANAVRDRLAGSPELGRLAELAEWAAGVRPGAVSGEFTNVRVVVFGGGREHAATEHLAGSFGAGVRCVADLPENVERAVDAGAALADDEIDGGADLLIAATPGAGAGAAIAVSLLTDTEPVKVLARGAAATDPEAWMALAREVRDGRRRCKGVRAQPEELLVAIGSIELAATAGFVLRAAARRTPVVLDGPVAVAAALVAYEAQPRAVRWWCAADLGPDPAQELALTRLGQRAVLGLGTGLGDGVAGLLAVQIVQSAVRLDA